MKKKHGQIDIYIYIGNKCDFNIVDQGKVLENCDVNVSFIIYWGRNIGKT